MKKITVNQYNDNNDNNNSSNKIYIEFYNCID